MQKSAAAKNPADLWKGVTSVAEWLSRKFGRKLDDVVPRPGSVSQEVFEAAPRPHTPSPDELILPPVNIYADAVKDLRRGGAPVGGGPGFHMPDPGPTNYAPPPTLGDAPRLPPVNMVDPPLSPTNRARRVARPEPPPETRWYNPRDLLRNIGGAPADSPGLGGLKSIYRGGFKPRYPGLDRPLGENTSGFFNLSFNNPYNKPNWYARPFDRTRQAVANSLRSLNKTQLGIGTMAAVHTASKEIFYEQPRQIADFVSKLTDLNEADEQELYESINGIEAFKILARYGTDWGDPFLLAATKDRWLIPGDRVIWDSARRAAYEQNQAPSALSYVASRVTPAGAAGLGLRHLMADPVPSVPRETSRQLYGNLIQTLLKDPEAIRNSNLLAALQDIIPEHIHEKLMTRLYDFGVEKKPGQDMANVLATAIEETRGRMYDAGITNPEDLSAAIVDSAFVPSKDSKREADLAGELVYLNNEVNDLYQQVNDHLRTYPPNPVPGTNPDWPTVTARLYTENPELYVKIVANNKKKSEVITALRTLHPNYYGVDTPNNTARKGQSILDSLFGGSRNDKLDRALSVPAAQEAFRLQNWHPGPDRPTTPQLGYEEMMAIIGQARNDPRFGQSNISPETIAELVKNYFTKKYNTNVPPTIRFK